MATRNRNAQSVIAQLMMEDIGMGPSSGSVKGGGPTQNMLGVPDDETQVAMISMSTNGEMEEDDSQGFTEKELKLTKRFVELVGGADRARELLDKVDECEDCLGLIDDEESSDDDIINHMAGLMPLSADLPTGISNSLGMSALYNPSATVGSM